MGSVAPLISVFRRPEICAVVGASLLMAGCLYEYDMERPDRERGTLGEELHHIWIKDSQRAATNADEKTELLDENEEEFVDAVDRTVPPGEVHEFDEFLVSALPVIEEGYLPAVSRRLPPIFEEATEDPALMATVDDPPTYGALDYLPPHQQGQTMSTAVNYDESHRVLGHVGDVLVAHDGLDDDGQSDIEVPSSYSDLLRALADVVDEEPSKDTTERWATTLRDLLMTPDNRYRSGGEEVRDNHVALFDDRGVPKVAVDDGEVPAPFTDSDGDGRADIDPDGRFMLDNGQVLDIAPMSTEEIDHPELARDIWGRVVLDSGHQVFEYVDISNTALPYLVRMTGELAGQDVFSELSNVTRSLLGPTVPGDDDRGEYRAFPGDHPIVDIVDAILSGLAISDLPEAAEQTARYIRREVDELAFLSHAVGEAGETLLEHPDVDIYPNQTLLHDLLGVMREIAAEPELWADVLDALRSPVIERGGEAMSTLITYRDEVAIPVEYRPGADDDAQGDYDQCFYNCRDSYDIGTEQRFDCIRDCPMDEIFSDPTDFDAPESETNRSRFQRLFHLLRDTTGVEYELDIEEIQEPWIGLDADALPPVVSLPGAAEAFLRTVAGELHLADYISDDIEALASMLEYLPGIDGGGGVVATVLSAASELFGVGLDVEPTPDQITRLFNQPNIEADFEDEGVYLDITDPTCKDDFVMSDHHADGLFAAEASGLIDVIQPLAQAFARHDREELLAELFLVVHDHYSGHDDMYHDAHGDLSPMKASNLVSAEPPLQEVLDDGTIFEALRAIALSTESMTDDEGVAIDERLRQLVYQWIRNDDGYSPRSEPYVIELNDGRTLDEVSRIDVMLDRFEEMVDRVEDDDQVRDDLESAVESFYDVVLSARKVDDGEYEFEEDGVVVLTSHWLEYLGERAAEMEQRGELEPWLTEDLPSGLHDVYTSRGFFAFVELVGALHEGEEGQELMTDAPAYFADDGQRADQVAMMLYGLIVQTFNLDELMPVGRFVLEVLDPDRDIAVEPYGDLPNGTLLAIMLERLPEVDEDGTGLDVVVRGSLSSDNYEPAWSVLVDIVLRYFSPNPASDERLGSDEVSEALDGIGQWIYDDYGGLERFYEIVEIRGNLELDDVEQ